MKFCFHRRFARLGEHDTRTTKDGQHLDVPVAHYESHEDFSYRLKNFDISLIYLSYDVVFNGKMQMISISNFVASM